MKLLMFIVILAFCIYLFRDERCPLLFKGLFAGLLIAVICLFLTEAFHLSLAKYYHLFDSILIAIGIIWIGMLIWIIFFTEFYNKFMRSPKVGILMVIILVGSFIVGIITMSSRELINNTYGYYKYIDIEEKESTAKKCQTTDGVKICLVNPDKETKQYVTVKDYEFLLDLEAINHTDK